MRWEAVGIDIELGLGYVKKKKISDGEDKLVRLISLIHSYFSCFVI